jgi:hypothetical protein
MGFRTIVHYDNSVGFRTPHLRVWYAGSDAAEDFTPTGTDSFGPLFDVASSTCSCPAALSKKGTGSSLEIWHSRVCRGLSWGSLQHSGAIPPTIQAGGRSALC